MIKKNLLKGICLLWLLLAVTPVLQAQDRAQQASELLDRLIAGQGDSVYVHLDDNIRKMLSVEMLNGLFKQLEQQAGKYQSHGEWKTEPINGMTIYYCDVKFERLPLRFLTAFNPDGKVNTIRFVPVPAEKTTPPTTSVQDKIKETDIQVCTGNFKLPGTLTLPKNGKDLPVVILVHGSGLSAQVPALLEQDGVFLCSGIIDTRADEVQAALEKNGLRVIRRREKTGWVALEAKLADQ